MFIKKDLRKIPRILADAALVVEEPADEGEQASKRVKRDVLTELKLARRKAEFKGSMNILCQPSNAPSMQHLISISVYDCNIKSLDGVGMFGSAVDGRSVCCPLLETLNVGRNPLTTLPDEISMLALSLKELWCDDCEITGPLPDCVLALSNLETLNMASNSITAIPEDIKNLVKLQRLCLDRNKISQVPEELGTLQHLEALQLRNNQIKFLPSVNTNLKLLHVSSNLLSSLPPGLTECTKLEILFCNSNRIRDIPMNLSELQNLKRVNLSNNQIDYTPTNFSDRFGDPDPTTGLCDKDDKCVVYIGQNEFNKTTTTSPGKTTTLQVTTTA